jgi:hypothetical protein
VNALADLLNIVDAPVSFPGGIEPKDKRADSEEQRQQEFLRLLPYVAPSLVVWAVPNAGRRTRWEVAKAKREGLKAGAPDLTICWNHGCAFLEFKAGRTNPTDDQVDMLGRLYRSGQRVAVVRTAQFAFGLLAEWGAPVTLRVLEGLR